MIENNSDARFRVHPAQTHPTPVLSTLLGATTPDEKTPLLREVTGKGRNRWVSTETDDAYGGHI